MIDALPGTLLVVASIGLALDLVVGLLFHMGRKHRQKAQPNVAATRRLENAAELIVVALVWLLAICTVLAGIYNGLPSQ